MSIGRHLSILIIFFKNPALALIDLSISSLYFIYFLSDLYYFLPSPDFFFTLVTLLFLIPLDGNLDCLFEIFLVS